MQESIKERRDGRGPPAASPNHRRADLVGRCQQGQRLDGRARRMIALVDAMPAVRARRCSRSSGPVFGPSSRTWRSFHCASTRRPIQPGGAP